MWYNDTYYFEITNGIYSEFIMDTHTKMTKKNSIRVTKHAVGAFMCLFAASLLLCVLFASSYFVQSSKSSNLQKQNEQLNTQLTSLNDEIAALDEKYNSLSEQAKQLTALVDADSAAASDDVSASFSAISSMITELENIKTTLEASLENVQAEKAQLEQTLAESSDQRYKELNDKYTELNQSYTDMEKTYSDLLVEYRILQKKLTGSAIIDSADIYDSYADLEKVCFLTFDDGPSTNNTPKILDILKQYDIKATFFVNKKGSKYDDLYKRIVNEGHAIGNHTATHEYDSVYTTLDGFLEEFNDLQEHVFSVTGVYPQVFRFPGGSGNTVHKSRNPNIMPLATKALQDMGVTYFDWNVNSTDADVKLQTVENIIKNATNTRGRSRIIVLMHDLGGKTTTPEALPQVIEELKSQGYEFRSLNNNVEPIQSRKPGE